MSQVLKVQCPFCRSKAVNRKTAWPVPGQLAQLYYTCTNIDCSATFRFNLENLHIITPSGLNRDNLVIELIKRLNPSEKQLALELLEAQ